MEARDNMWLLQTDPDYFCELATYWSEYNIYTIPGAKATKEVKLHFLGGRLAKYSMTQVEEWELLEDELRYVLQIFDVGREAIRPGGHLPEAYDQALGRLELLVTELLIHKSEHLKELYAVSPAWKHMYRVEENLGGGKLALSFTADWKPDDPVYNRLMALGAIGERPLSTG